MAGPKNSIQSDPTPWQPPVEDPQKATKPKASDWARLGRSRKYKEVDNYMQAREEYWRHYLPDGSAYKDLYITNPEAAMKWGAVASVIIDEIETIRFKVQTQ